MPDINALMKEDADRDVLREQYRDVARERVHEEVRRVLKDEEHVRASSEEIKQAEAVASIRATMRAKDAASFAFIETYDLEYTEAIFELLPPAKRNDQ